MKSEIFAKELNYIKTDKIRDLVRIGLENLPDYFYTMPASTTGKYHPSYALGTGGLVRHTKAAALFCYYICGLEQTQKDFNQMERDCMIAGIILHDGHKEGNKGSSYTVFEHPQICADWIRNDNIFADFDPKYRGLIASVIESHMGQWNTSTRSKLVLSKPTTPYQKIVHLCDYLASRKDIEVKFSEVIPVADISSAELPPLEEYTMPFGKYKGKLLTDVAKEDRDYVEWLYSKCALREPLKTYVSNILKGEQ